MKRRIKVLIPFFLFLLLLGCGKEKEKEGPEMTTYISAGFNREIIQEEIPNFTMKDENHLSERLMDQMAKVDNLEDLEKEELTKLREKIFRKKSDEIFEGYDFSKEEKEFIGKESSISYTRGGIYYGEDKTGKIEFPEE